MALDLQRIKALCFDVDGTLSDTDDLYTARAARLLRPVRFLFRNGDHTAAARRFVMWAEAPGNALIGIPDSLGFDEELLRLSEWLNRRRPRPLKHFMLVPGVETLLGQLHGRFPMSIVSARDERSTRAFLDQFGLSGHFEVIVAATTAEHTKPFPDPILYAARRMGVDPAGCLMIGDTTVDIRAGKSAGAQTVGVLCGFGEEQELRRQGADLILPATPDLAGVLLG